MNAIFNQFSYVFISIAVMIGVLVILRALRWTWRRSLPVIIIAGLSLLGAWFSLRPSMSDANEMQTVELLLSNGRPTLVEFFSQYCLGCVSVKPAVEALVVDIQDEFNILRVDIHTDLGRTLRDRYTFSYSPEFLLFDRTGQEVWRAHVPPAAQQLALASGTS
jgi:thiol-disulfide isomerase/thioredoxin